MSSNKSSGKFTLAILLFCVCSHGASPFQSAELHAQGHVKAVYRLPKISIKEFQNAQFPGSVANDRKLILGSMGSDLWHDVGADAGEFWMVTDRGPNGQGRIDGKNVVPSGSRSSTRQFCGSKPKAIRFAY